MAKSRTVKAHTETITMLAIVALLVCSLGLASCACSTNGNDESDMNATTAVDNLDSNTDDSQAESTSNNDDSVDPMWGKDRSEYVLLNVPCTWNQYDVGLPTGCESMAITHLLQYLGFDLEPTVIADQFMPRSNTDFIYAFLGNPHSYNGNAIMAPGAAETANRFLDSRGSSLHAYDATGMPFDLVIDKIDNGEPVVVWTTIDMQEPLPIMRSNGYTLFGNSHCVVVDGFNQHDGTIHVSDSISGPQWRDMSRFREIYDTMGSQAVVIKQTIPVGTAQA